MSDTPRTDALEKLWTDEALPTPYIRAMKFARELERLLTECYNSGGLSPDLMKRVGKALGGIDG